MAFFKKKQNDMPEKFRNEQGIVLSKNYIMETDINKKGVHNNNVIAIGQSGVGKTRHFVIPNILQKNANYIINDRGGAIYEKTASNLEAAGYNVIKISLEEIPEYLYIFNNNTRVEDIEVFTQTLYKNSSKVDAFWGDIEKKLMSAITWCFLLQNRGTVWGFKKMLDMLNMFYEPIDETTTKLDVFINKIVEMNQNEAGAELAKLYEPFKRLHQSNKKGVADSLKSKLRPFATTNPPKTLDLSQEKTVIYVTYELEQPNVALLLSVLYLYIIKELYTIEHPFTEIIWENFNDIGYIDALTNRTIKAAHNNVSFLVTAESVNTVSSQYDKEYLYDIFDTIVFMGTYNQETTAFIQQIAQIITQRPWSIKDIQKLSPAQVLILMSRAGVYTDEKL